LRQRLWKVGAVVVTSARRIVLRLSETWPRVALWGRVQSAVQAFVERVRGGGVPGQGAGGGLAGEGRPAGASSRDGCRRRRCAPGAAQELGPAGQRGGAATQMRIGRGYL